MKRSAALLLALGFFLPCICSAQKEFNVWCFGKGAGIDFNGTSPAASASALNDQEGCASIADRNTGALLFYTDGEKIYRNDHAVMLNGAGLMGSTTSTQSALIVPKPGDEMGYYVFTSDAGAYDHLPGLGINYSVVDMRLDGGRGAVTEKNIRLLDSAPEKLTVIRHGDGCSFWIISHGWKSDAFYAWRLTDSGLAPPVVSNVGIVQRDLPGFGPGSGTLGVMKPSPDGTRLAVLLYAMNIAQLFSFDPATGVVSNPVSIAPGGSPYGASFSPDNSKLYISAEPHQLLQYDVRGGDSASIAATGTLISDSTDLKNVDSYGALQLAPDGRIYHARLTSHWLGGIANPNASGVACGYAFHAVDLGADRNSWFGLPNLIEGYFATGNLLCGGPTVRFSGRDTICAGESIRFVDQSTNGPTSWAWSFAGTNPAVWNGQAPPALRYDAPGSYQVSLTVANPVISTTLRRTVTVLPAGEIRSHIAADYSAFPGDTVVVRVVLDRAVDAAGITSLAFSLRYVPGMLRLDGILQSGFLLNGWSIDSLANDTKGGSVYARFSAPPGGTLAGTGDLLALRFLTFLDSTDSSALAFDLRVPGIPCMIPVLENGFIRLPVCGSRNRLIVATGDPYHMDRPRPDPATDLAEISYSLGLDGPTTLAIFDERGERVATLVDGYQTAGRHSAVWRSSGKPSGLYFYRIVSGDWSRTGTLLLAR